MPTTIDLAAILALPVADRLDVADAIYAYLPDPPPGMRAGPGERPEVATLPAELAAILALPVADQLDIAHTIYASIPDGERPPVELSDELKRELDRRLQDARDNPDAGVPWEEVKRGLLARRAV